VARQIASRDAATAAAIHPAAAPEEIRTMVEALNGLFQRVEQTHRAERRFTADAAHELRTPLAALQAQLQVALRARDDEERDRSLQQLQSGLSRAAHLVDQMLQLARLDPESGLPNPQPVDLTAARRSGLRRSRPANPRQATSISLRLDAAPGCIVTGQAEWLRVLIRNLVDNAMRYTPAGGTLHVGIVPPPTDQQCRLTRQRQRPGHSGRRSAKPSSAASIDWTRDGQPGSGLGLAIVARIAELHGAQLELSDGVNAHGLEVTVAWKKPA
jgi:two-component system sensor histidine kinase QseC